ncbi:hypothetical protein CCR75_007050 [Bremia lactucae]|uniref:PX domain-containing protein n=1 Tax=Bremia lactucae TaxID=4779 RepID=A0A976IFJ9_BRELC|nr:hypothetical protein CCR75_007050 [Bremia lactucae]
MGCKNSKDVTHRGSFARPLHPSTPSYHAQESKFCSGSRSTNNREELPSFVVSDSLDLVGSSDGEPVHGLVSAFTFSFIHLSEIGSTSSRSSTSVSEEIKSPASSTCAVAGDPIELLPIAEERSGAREASSRTIVDPAHTPSGSCLTEPESSPITFVGESSAVSASAITELSDMLINDLDASIVSHHSDISTIALSETIDVKENVITDTIAAVDQVPHNELTLHTTSDYLNDMALIQETVAAIVQEVIDNTVSGEQDQVRYEAVSETQSSLQVEHANSGVYFPSMKAPHSDKQKLRRPIYAIVDTSTVNGVILYHVQLMNETADSTKWPTMLHRRYSQFLEMYLKLKESYLPASDELPHLSRAGVIHFVRGRQSKTTIEERQLQFSSILRYITEHCELHDSAAFQTFLTQ